MKSMSGRSQTCKWKADMTVMISTPKLSINKRTLLNTFVLDFSVYSCHLSVSSLVGGLWKFMSIKAIFV